MLWSKRLDLRSKWSDKFVILNEVRNELCHCCREWYPVHQCWWLILWVIWVMGDPIRNSSWVWCDVSSAAPGHVARISWESSYSWLGCMLDYLGSNYSFELLYLFYWATKRPNTNRSWALQNWLVSEWYGQIGALEVFKLFCEMWIEMFNSIKSDKIHFQELFVA